jgi:hypothetical protein
MLLLGPSGRRRRSRDSASQKSPATWGGAVIRTLFTGTVLGVGEWEVLWNDRKSYSISVLVVSDGTTITSLTWRELLATSNRLLHMAGSRSRAVGCRIK